MLKFRWIHSRRHIRINFAEILKFLIPIVLIVGSYFVSVQIRDAAVVKDFGYVIQKPVIYSLPHYEPISKTGGEIWFDFEYKGGIGEIIFVAGGIEYEDEVSVYVNGLPAGRADIAQKKWGVPQSILLDERYFVYGKNYLVFRNNYESEKWGVRFLNIRFIGSELVNLSQSKEYYDLATRILAEGGEKTLPEALKYLRESIDKSYMLIPRPAFWNEALLNYERVNNMINTIFKDILKRCAAIFEKDKKESSYRQAVECLEDAEKFIGDNNDYRVRFLDVYRDIMKSMIVR